MRRISCGRATAILAAMMLISGLLFAEPISMEGRTVLVQIESGKAATESVRAVNRDSAGLSVTFEATSKALEGDVRSGGPLFAARVACDPNGPAPRLLLNGLRVDIEPLRRSDDWVVRLPAGRIKPGENSLTVSAAAGATPPTVDAIEVFSLADSFEEVHFGPAFADPTPTLLVQPAQDADQLKIDILHYDLSIALNMTTTVIAATLTCTGRVISGPLNQVVLDFNTNGGQLAVGSVDDGNPGNPIPLNYVVDTANNRLRIALASAAATSDTFTVRIAYSGAPSSGGTFGSPYVVSTHGSPAVPVVYTFSEPYGARQWWPCKDVPEDKATIDLHIQAPDPYFVVSNGDLVATTDLGGGVKRSDYSETYPVATYLVSICCSNYAFAPGTYTALDGQTTMNMGHYVYPENLAVEGGAVPGTLEAIGYFARTFGEYPFLREKYVTASHNSGSGMEHQTCTSMPGGDLTAGGLARRNIHELSHMWFGDLVTMNHFDHLWLNEGFATYCEALFYEYKYGKDYYLSYVNGWISTGVSTTTPLVSTNADSFNNSVVYRRGGFVLHMLRHVVGDDVFFKACRLYLKNHAYGTALTPDLQSAFETYYGQSLDWFFQEWVYTATRLTYVWSWQLTQVDGKNILNIAINQTQSGNAFTMPIDIRVTDFQGHSKTFVIWNDQKSQTLPIDIGDFPVDTVAFDPDGYILKRITNPTAAPMPTLQRVEASSGGASALLTWTPGIGAVSGFQAVISDSSLTTWTLVSPLGDIPSTATTFTVTGLTPGADHYFRIRARSATGPSSAFSDVYGCRSTGSAASRVLIVDGYDRWDSQGRGTSHPWAASHGVSAAAYGANFDTVANESVQSGAVALGGYSDVLWVLGEESTADETFSTAEQGVVEAYLQGGGRLFVSGAEIGWDLDYRGAAADQAFYHDYLKAAFVDDDSGLYTVSGTAGGTFPGMTFTYDDGSAGIYFANYPDVIAPSSGGVAALQYEPSGAVAGVQFDGLFPNAAQSGRLVYFAFPFETIDPRSSRDAVMARVLSFLDNGRQPMPNGYTVF